MTTLSEQNRDEAVRRVEAATDKDWKDDAKIVLLEAVIEHKLPELTTDDLRCRRPREPRAWGPIMLWGVKEGYIQNTERTRRSTEPQCNARPKTIWRNLI